MTPTGSARRSALAAPGRASRAGPVAPPLSATVRSSTATVIASRSCSAVQPIYTVALQLRPDTPHEPEGGSGVVWTRSSLARGDELDLQLSVSVQPDVDDRGAPVRTLRIWCCIVTPRGSGTVRLKSADPQVTPRIDYRLLSHLDDQQRLREALALARRIAAAPTVAAMIDAELSPDADVWPRDDLDEALHAGTMTFYHGTSTAPMGSEEDTTAVVDATGRVRGIGGLRVVDASIIPNAVSVPINLTTIMLAERIARFIAYGAFPDWEAEVPFLSQPRYRPGHATTRTGDSVVERFPPLLGRGLICPLADDGGESNSGKVVAASQSYREAALRQFRKRQKSRSIWLRWHLIAERARRTE